MVVICNSDWFAACPPGYQYNADIDACYKYYPNEVCVRDAVSRCTKDRGDLVSILSENENSYFARQ